ncbi:hypothetical protein TcWFU_002664 [Taenia crassiceps]|uniref:Uncharacterized protein n=1 Tax=Taenia crassiceps TaxID=6207 RepID=A0ABR4QPH5_9CEST
MAVPQDIMPPTQANLERFCSNAAQNGGEVGAEEALSGAAIASSQSKLEQQTQQTHFELADKYLTSVMVVTQGTDNKGQEYQHPQWESSTT